MKKIIQVGFFIMVLEGGVVFAEMIDRVVARINSDIVTLSEVSDRTRLLKMKWMQSSPEDYPSDKELQKDSLDLLIEERLLIQEGNRLEMKVDEEKVKQAVEDIKLSNRMNDDVLKMMLEREGISLEQYKNKIREQILMSKVRSYQMRNRIRISDYKLKRYYANHRKDFRNPQKIHARHILFILGSTLSDAEKGLKRKKAKEIYKEVKSGKDFGTLAKLYSEDVSASSGGDLGILERGKMVKGFEDAAFKLRAGEVSPIVETEYGLHIIKVDKRMSSKIMPFDKVRPQIERIFYNQEAPKQYKLWVDELKNNAFVENLLDKSRLGINVPMQQMAKLHAMKKNKKKKLFSSDEKNQKPKISELEASKSSRTKILPFQENEVSRTKHQKIEIMEKGLRYIKILKKRKIITDQEYEQRKEKLLNQL